MNNKETYSSVWENAQAIVENEKEYEIFLSEVREFMLDNEMSVFQMSNETGISRPVLSAFLKGNHRGLSFKTVGRLINFMIEFQKQNAC